MTGYLRLPHTDDPFSKAIGKGEGGNLPTAYAPTPILHIRSHDDR